MTTAVLAPGWSLWVGDRLLVEGEQLDQLEPEAQDEFIRQGRAVRVAAEAVA